MIAFELTITGGRWSGENQRHIVFKKERPISKETKDKILDKCFFYDFKDGWEAMIHVYKINFREAKKTKTDGLRGYDWMVDSILEKGKIEWEEKYAEKTRFRITCNVNKGKLEWSIKRGETTIDGN